MKEDLYAILGVLPEAENVVIAAAYRVLAGRYHPDRWNGDEKVAHEKMSALNRAYEILGNPAKRKAYDRERSGSESCEFSDSDETLNSEFQSAAEELKDRWSIATEFYPDLESYRSKLSVYSPALAYAYAVTVLESKSFDVRGEMFERYKKSFLERYFGKHHEIVELARALIENNMAAAAKDLNKYVVVMGSGPYERIGIMEKIFQKYGRKYSYDVRLLRVQFLEYADPNCAIEICIKLGYRVEKIRKYFDLLFDKLILTLPSGERSEFSSTSEFVSWFKLKVFPNLTP